MVPYLLSSRCLFRFTLFLSGCMHSHTRRTSVVVDFAGQLAGLQSAALAYSDLSVAGDPTEAAEGLFRALRWAEGQPSAERLLIAGVWPFFFTFPPPTPPIFSLTTHRPTQPVSFFRAYTPFYVMIRRTVLMHESSTFFSRIRANYVDPESLFLG